MKTTVTNTGVLYTYSEDIDSVSEYYSDEQLYHLQNTFGEHFLEYIENRLKKLLKDKRG
jgi:ADP-dependent phosphofructokinase/glucokinase